MNTKHMSTLSDAASISEDGNDGDLLVVPADEHGLTPFVDFKVNKHRHNDLQSLAQAYVFAFVTSLAEHQPIFRYASQIIR